MSRLYPCVYCTEDGYCKKFSDEEVKSWCVQSPCKDERPSNADRIRAMTDEELAKFLDCYCVSASWECPRHHEIKCHECWLEWLKKEVDDDRR